MKPQTILAEAVQVADRPLTLVRPPRVKLTTIRDCRREAAKVYLECRRGLIDPSDATKLSYQLQTIGKLIEAGDMEERLVALESKHGVA